MHPVFNTTELKKKRRRLYRKAMTLLHKEEEIEAALDTIRWCSWKYIGIIGPRTAFK